MKVGNSMISGFYKPVTVIHIDTELRLHLGRL